MCGGFCCTLTGFVSGEGHADLRFFLPCSISTIQLPSVWNGEVICGILQLKKARSLRHRQHHVLTQHLRNRSLFGTLCVITIPELKRNL